MFLPLRAISRSSIRKQWLKQKDSYKKTFKRYMVSYPRNYSTNSRRKDFYISVRDVVAMMYQSDGKPYKALGKKGY